MLGGKLIDEFDDASGVPIGETEGVWGGGSAAPIAPGLETGRALPSIGAVGFDAAIGRGGFTLASLTFCVEV
jgi:hypothetical protein